MARRRGALFGLATLLVAASAVGMWFVTGLFQEDDPNNPPATIDWHGCSYRRLETVESLKSATAFEHQASAYEGMRLQRIGEDGGLPIFGLPLNLSNPYPCSGPWFIHLKVGADRYWRYHRSGGP